MTINPQGSTIRQGQNINKKPTGGFSGIKDMKDNPRGEKTQKSQAVDNDQVSTNKLSSNSFTYIDQGNTYTVDVQTLLSGGTPGMAYDKLINDNPNEVKAYYEKLDSDPKYQAWAKDQMNNGITPSKKDYLCKQINYFSNEISYENKTQNNMWSNNYSAAGGNEKLVGFDSINSSPDQTNLFAWKFPVDTQFCLPKKNGEIYMPGPDEHGAPPSSNGEIKGFTHTWDYGNGETTARIHGFDANLKGLKYDGKDIVSMSVSIPTDPKWITDHIGDGNNAHVGLLLNDGRSVELWGNKALAFLNNSNVDVKGSMGYHNTLSILDIAAEKEGTYGSQGISQYRPGHVDTSTSLYSAYKDYTQNNPVYVAYNQSPPELFQTGK